MAAAAAEEFVVIIVGAGPAGLAAEVHINHRYEQRVINPPRVLRPLKTIIIEKTNETAPLWRRCTYDNLTLQCRKHKCALSHQEFPESCPEYPRRSDFIEYLDEYTKKLKNEPHFNTEVTKAEFSEADRRWKITTRKHTPEQPPETKMYSCDFLVVASGLCAVPRIPDNLPGLEKHFPPSTRVDPTDQLSPMKRIYSTEYKNGEKYSGKKVLVVGCGDSGIDICGDLHNAGATPYIVVNRLKDDKSVNKRTEDFYKKVRGVDGKIDWSSKIKLSDLSKDVRNRGQCKLGNIDKDCTIEVYFCSNILRFRGNSVDLLDRDSHLDIDCVILATGYDHNVNDWLKGEKITFNEKGDLQFDDAVGDNIIGAIEDKPLFKRRISAIGFYNEKGLHGLKLAVKEIYDEIQKE